MTNERLRVLDISVTFVARDAEHIPAIREAAVKAAREAAREAGATIVGVGYGTRSA